MEQVVVLAEELSFRRAADRLGVAQSGLSQQLRRLERELGTTLFSRSTHHVGLTPAGAAFLVEARRVLAAAARARDVARLGADPGLRLVVGIGDGSIDTLPTVLAELRVRRPDVEVVEVAGGLPLQRRLLARGEMDVALSLLEGDPGPGLSARLVRREPLGVVLADEHPAAEVPALRWDDLRGARLVLGPEADYPEYNAFVRGVLAEYGPIQTEELFDIQAAVTTVVAGGGVLCVPELAVLPVGARWRRLVEPAADLPTSLVWRRHDDRPLVRELLAVAEAVGRRDGWLGRLSGR